MAFARLEHDFAVIEGPQGSLPLTVVSSSNESATVLQCFPCLQRGLKGHSYSVFGGARAVVKGVQHVKDLEQLGNGLCRI